MEEYLDGCLTCLQRQTFDDFEIIAVNDGSTDSSLEILKLWKQKSDFADRLTIISVENGGASRARNCALDNSRGQYIVFFDADDLMHPQLLELAHKYIVKDSLDMFVMEHDKFNANSEICNKQNLDDNHYQIISHQQALIHPYYHIEVWGHIVKKKIIDDLHLRFKEGIVYEDLLFEPILYLNSQNIGHYDFPLYHYRTREGSVMRSKKNRNHKCNSALVVAEELSTFQNLDSIDSEFIQYRIKEALFRFAENGGSIRQLNQLYSKYKLFNGFTNRSYQLLVILKMKIRNYLKNIK